MTRQVSFARSSQDKAGRSPYNPKNAPKVTRVDVLAYAKEYGFRVEREGQGMWWYWKGFGQRRTAGMTNYLCIETMKRAKR